SDNIYCRGVHLVQVIHYVPPPRKEASEARQPVERPAEAPVVRDLPAPTLREELTRCVECVQIRKVKDGNDTEYPVSLPGHVPSALLARGKWQGIPPLAGVVSHPVLLPDGTLLATPGYDPDSGLLLWLPSGLQVEVKEHPTRDDAVAACGVLLDVVSDFP